MCFVNSRLPFQRLRSGLLDGRDSVQVDTSDPAELDDHDQHVVAAAAPGDHSGCLPVDREFTERTCGPAARAGAGGRRHLLTEDVEELARDCVAVQACHAEPLGAERAAGLTHVSADGAEWIHDVVAERAPKAVLCLDAFHVVAWATDALDQVRRAMVNRLRAGGHHDEAAALKGSRWALLKNPPNLTGNQRTTLAGIAKANGGLYRAYLLKEQLREIFACRDSQKARALLGGWIAWAQRCRLEPFVKLAKTIKRYRALILAAVEHGLSNARSEATNTHLRLLTRRAYGYHSPEALIAMADLTRGGLCPPLPGRS